MNIDPTTLQTLFSMLPNGTTVYLPMFLHFLVILATVGYICAAIATKLPPPTTVSSTTYMTVYRMINWIGLNFGHARNANGALPFVIPSLGTITITPPPEPTPEPPAPPETPPAPPAPPTPTPTPAPQPAEVPPPLVTPAPPVTPAPAAEAATTPVAPPPPKEPTP